jgi:DNA-binding transcriptional ArsR family regulator
MRWAYVTFAFSGSSFAGLFKEIRSPTALSGFPQVVFQSTESQNCLSALGIQQTQILYIWGKPSPVAVARYMSVYSYTLAEGRSMKTSADLKAGILIALAHPNRIRILELLRNDVMCNCELAPALELEQSNLSRHLKILVQSGILVSWKEGLRVNFKVADDRIFSVLELAASVAKRETEMKAQALKA